jgi:hypothetical protein
LKARIPKSWIDISTIRNIFKATALKFKKELVKEQAMNEKEKKDFYVAMCQCCLISQAMKTCPLCHFNIGLVEPVNQVNSELLPIAVQIPIFALSEQC